MRAIYTAPTVAAAEAEFEAFRDDWAATYPAMIRSWENSWIRVRAVPRVPSHELRFRRLHHQRLEVTSKKIFHFVSGDSTRARRRVPLSLTGNSSQIA